MKRFWYTWLLVVANATLATTASAQQDWNQPSDIGSYQSIMSRAGVNQGGYDLGQPVQQRVEMQNRSPMMNGNHSGYSGNGSVGNGNVYGGGVPNGQMNGNVTHGQAIAAPAMQGREVYGGSVGGAVPSHASAPGYGAQPYAAGPAVAAGQPVFAGGNTQPTYFDSCDQGCVSEGVAGAMGGRAANWVLGTNALFLNRNNESAVPLARNGAGATLLSTDNNYNTMQGGEASLIRRSCSGSGAQLRYWGLFPNQNDTTFLGPALDTYLVGLGGYSIAPGPVNVLTQFNSADSFRIYRNNDIHSLELNGLRNGGNYTTLFGKSATYELLGGVRWFQFNENYRFAAFNSAGLPNQINYDLATRNTLLGLQLGGRSERCLTDRLSLVGGTRFGLFNNRSISRQSITSDTGNLAYVTGDPAAVYNFNAQRDGLATLGELDMGIAYRFSQRMRANIGYRVVGVSGLALAPNQIPRNFLNPAEMNRVNANDSLILNGGYAGLEMCF